MGDTKPKQYITLGKKTVLEYTLDCFLDHPSLKKIVVALAAADTYWHTLPCSENSHIDTVRGGDTRAFSVLYGLQHLLCLGAKENDWVLVHDAVRPNLSKKDINNLLSTLAADKVGGFLASPSINTLKRVTSALRVEETMNRSVIWNAYTPQMFRLGLLYQALTYALNLNLYVTDESSAIERIGFSPKIVLGRTDNIKITVPEDLQLLASLWAHTSKLYMRIGHGYDVHALGAGNSITLGGVSIPHNQSLLAHSDGDVLLHAIIDALLGAAGLGDIGYHFPDTEEQYENINSRFLLHKTLFLLTNKGWKVGNIDSTIIAQTPKLMTYIPSMKEHIAHDLQIDITQINIKATTTETLGFAGRKEGIAAHSVALLFRVST
ncbi:UNVERIFIED_CONTAM: hypothetical protein GTU68_010974 [Idotea baltica]|nr:hypothetical protein [Idotea baltica]